MSPREIYDILKKYEQAVCKMLNVSGILLVKYENGEWITVDDGKA
jgi:hypothetical protein